MIRIHLAFKESSVTEECCPRIHIGVPLEPIMNFRNLRREPSLRR